MKILIFGGGDLADSIYRRLEPFTDEVKILSKAECDASDYIAVCQSLIEHRPDFVISTAGLSDRIPGVTIRDVVEANLLTAMYVGTAAGAYGLPCILVASTAGMSPGTHTWYGPAKAGVISFVRAMANSGHKIWVVSPGRMDTKMRQADWPDEDPDTRLDRRHVAGVISRMINGRYAPGANVVVRKVGYDRVDIYEEAAPCLPSLI